MFDEDPSQLLPSISEICYSNTIGHFQRTEPVKINRPLCRLNRFIVAILAVEISQNPWLMKRIVDVRHASGNKRSILCFQGQNLPQLPALLVRERSQSQGIFAIRRTVSDIGIEIAPSIEPDRVFAQESSGGGIIVSGPVDRTAITPATSGKMRPTIPNEGP